MSESLRKTIADRTLQKRDAILDRAAEVFSRLGIRGAPLAVVAAEGDLSIASIRHYFPRREDLAAAVIQRSIETMKALADEAADEATPELRVRALVRLFFDFRRRVLEGAAPEIVYFAELRSLKPPYSDLIWPIYADLFRAFRRLIQAENPDATQRMRANLRTHLLMTQLSRSSYWLPRYTIDDYTRVEAYFIDILLNGISKDGSWRPRALDLPEEESLEKRSLDSFLQAATLSLNESGYRGASIHQIAGRINVTKGAFYHHATGKDDLVAACCDRTFRFYASAQRQAAAVETRGLDQASTAVTTLVALQHRAPGSILRNSAFAAMDVEIRTRNAARMQQISQRFADMVSDGWRDGSTRPCNPRVAGYMLMSVITSAEELERWAPGIDEDIATDLFARPIFRGLLS